MSINKNKSFLQRQLNHTNRQINYPSLINQYINNNSQKQCKNKTFLRKVQKIKKYEQQNLESNTIVLSQIFKSLNISLNLDLSINQTNRSIINRSNNKKNSNIKQFSKFNEHQMMKMQDIRSRIIEKTQCISRIDQIEYILEKMNIDYEQYYKFWEQMYHSEIQYQELQKKLQRTTQTKQIKNNKIEQLKEDLYLINRSFFKIDQTEVVEQSNLNLDDHISEIIQQHNRLKERLAGNKVNFMQKLIFTIKVLMPNHIISSCLKLIYQKLLEFKLSNKLNLLIKKEMMDLNPKQVKYVQQFMKFLIEKQNNKTKKSEKKNRSCNFQYQKFHDNIQTLIKQINILQIQVNNLDDQIIIYQNNCEQLKAKIQKQEQKLFRLITQQCLNLSNEYQIYTNTNTNFIVLVTNQIKEKYIKYKQIIKQKHQLQRSLQINIRQINQII